MQVATSSRPPDSGRLAERDPAIRRHVDEREAEPRQVVDVLHAGIGEASAGQLSGAFQHVPGQRPGGELVPIVVGPAERVQHRAEEQRRVSDPPGDHHLRAGIERPGHDVGAEIGVGRGHARQDRFQWRAIFHQPQRRVVAHDLGHVVAQDDGAAYRSAQPQPDAASVSALAAPSGLAAPMFDTMRTPRASDGGSTASIRSSIVGV